MALSKQITRNILIYLGGAWAFIEALNFVIDKYGVDSRFLDALILVALFGIPAVVLYELFNHAFPVKAIILHSINGVLALTVIIFSLVNPSSIDTKQIRLLNFDSDKQKRAESIRSLAVLPFADLVGDDSKQYLVAGMHSALINELSKLSSIRVISKTSMLHYEDSKLGLKEIATELGVDGIIEGSVLGVGDNIEVQMNLISIFPEEYPVWTDKLVLDRNQLQDVYGQAVTDIAKKINVTLTPQEQRHLSASHQVNPAAYRAYLNGKFQLEKVSEESFQLAGEYFQEAIRIDSTFAQAYAEMINWYLFRMQMRLISPTEALPKIFQYNRKAFEIDPNLPDAHYYRGMLSWFQWDWEACNEAYSKALELEPNHVLANAFYSHYWLIHKQFDKAKAYASKAVSLDPKNDLVLSLYAVVLMGSGDWDESFRMWDAAASINPSNMMVSGTREFRSYMSGDYDKSVSQLEQRYGPILGRDIGLSERYEALGYKETIRYLASLLETKEGQAFSAYFCYARIGDSDKAIEWLEKSIALHDPDVPYAFNREMEYLRSNPKYIELARKVNLPP